VPSLIKFHAVYLTIFGPQVKIFCRLLVYIGLMRSSGKKIGPGFSARALYENHMKQQKQGRPQNQKQAAPK
jgi:hypothetical protein